ncbi:MAG: poly-gamma-glutamate capsule biosynthesis protein CapA/YwtB (metallophosphatase superfamily) [Myxococcota bacterium]|jgi:poly-gamma-glutamate capsule biosynthesis protein CapA/YwtB (metallophosphatase superfamily)
MVAVGDLLIHRRVKNTAKARASEHGNDGFDWVFAEMKPLLSGADLAFANLETPVAPDHHRGIRGEIFNAPAGVIGAIADAGIDVVSFANNHTFDQGPAGIVETLERLEAAGVAVAGSGRSCAEASSPVRLEVNGVRVALLAVTDLMNIDERAGEDAPCTFVAGPICSSDCGPDRDAIHYAIDRERLAEAITAARVGADAVVVSFHWGDEYRTVPLPLYTETAPILIELGADVVLGHHPHVLQPLARHTAEDGREGLIVYSLGNFVSDMGASYSPASSSLRRGNTRDGLLVGFSLVKTRHPDGRATVAVESVEAVPLWTENNKLTRGSGEADAIRVVPLAAASDAALMAKRRAVVVEVVGEAWLSPAAPLPDR